MRRLCTSLVLAAQLLGASAAHATVNWDWSFTQATVNLAQSPSVYVTVTNLSTSDDSIAAAYIDFSSFGTFGVLVDPSNGNQITPSIRPISSPIAPGQSATFEALSFFFSGASNNGRPSSIFAQTITPSMNVRGGNCNGLPGCVTAKPSETALTLIYAPVPEATSGSLWIVGLAGLVAVFWRRRVADIA